MSKLCENKVLYRLPFAVFLSGIMFLFIMLTGNSVGISEEDLVLTSLLFSLLYLGVLCVFAALKEFDNITLLFVAAAVAALICIRVSLLHFASRDYNVFLSQWLSQMREYKGLEALRVQIGDYNMPYLYFLFIISKFNLSDLVLIKWFSCVFDFVCAFFVMKCVGLKFQNIFVKIAAFFTALALPTVLMNSAYWGQCDSILAAGIVASFYFLLKGNGRLATVMFALAFSFKLQAIFVLPAFIVAIIVGKVKLKDLIYFPLTFIATLLPAIFAGRSIIDSLSIYFMQTTQYPELTLNAPSVYQLISNKASFESFNFLGIMLSGLCALLLIFLCFVFKDKIGQKQLVLVFFLSSLLLPFLLPRMHERYFFIADILSIIYLFYNPKRWYFSFITVFASYNACANYLSGGNLLIEQKYCAIALLITIILLTKELVSNLKDCGE